MSYENAVKEMHILAYCYHWGRNDLWDMSCSERRMWCEMVLAQKKAENKGVGESDDSVSTYSES